MPTKSIDEQLLLSSKTYVESKKYWLNQLSGLSQMESAAIFTDVHSAHREKSLEASLPGPVAQKLLKVCRNNELSVYIYLLSAYAVLTYKYGRSEGVLVNAPVFTREFSEGKEQFNKVLPILLKVAGDMSFRELLTATANLVMDAGRHQHYPLNAAGAELSIKDQELLGETLFLYPPFHEEESVDEGAWPFVFRFERKDDDLIFKLRSAAGLPFSLQQFFTHFGIVLEHVLAHPNGLLRDITPLGAEEKQQILHDFNHTTTYFPEGRTIVDLFEEQAALTPDAEALVFENRSMTYAELDEKANGLASYLKSRGIGDEVLVPICFHRSLEMIVAIIGVLKSGAAYVPVSPAHPKERILPLMQDLDASLLLTEKSLLSLFSGAGVDVQPVCFEEWSETFSSFPVQRPVRMLQEENLAYVIYTSGSTGRPKGVMVEHKSIYNYICHQAGFMGVSADDRILQFSNYCFDASIEQIFLALCTGAALVLVPEKIVLEPELFSDYLVRQRITHLHATPSFLETVLPGDYKLQRVVAGGEACPRSLFEKWKGSVKFYNKYGPTETTVTSVEYCFDDENIRGKSLSIGKPVSNNYIYIIDRSFGLCPVGVTGELCIGGTGLARGYLNEHELTRNRYVPNPFGSGRLYRTGDLARWREDGFIDFIGRLDDQVKVRGYRVEPGEVEHILKATPGVQRAVVLAINDNGSNRLVAYVVPAGSYDAIAVTHFLQERLPAYMQPSHIIELPELPLTPNGKLDRRLMATLGAASRPEQHQREPSTPMEEAVARIWKKLLGIEHIGTTENFFEAGGHSLLAMRLSAAIFKETGRQLKVKEVFEHPTILQQAALLGKGTADEKPFELVSPRPAHIPLSFSQERLWFMDRLLGSVQYHMPYVLELQGELDVAALEAAFRAIISRHEVLRTTIVEEEGKGYQKIGATARWPFVQLTESEAEAKSESLHEYIDQAIAQPFDLGNEYPLRVQLVTRSVNDHCLIVVLHHIASDGWSMGLLTQELTALYQSFSQNKESELPWLEWQYADYTVWQRHYLQDGRLQEQLDYWTGQLGGVEPLALATDCARPPQQSTRGGRVQMDVDKEVHRQLAQLSQTKGATLFMTLLAAFKTVLYRYTGQSDLCVGTPTAGRPYQELEGLIGFFVNTLAIRSRVQGDESFEDLLEQLRETTLQAYEHQQVPFERIVEALGVERDLSRSPLFQILFSVQNAPSASGGLVLPGVELNRIQSSGIMAQYDLSMEISEKGEGGLHISLTYCSDLYKEETAGRLLQHYCHLLSQLPQQLHQPLHAVSILNEGEQKQLWAFGHTPSVGEAPCDTIIGLFNRQIKETPHNIAIATQDEELTYEELDRKSNQLANHLIHLGVGREVLVPVCLDRSADMVISILAILKAGGAYVPLDPGYPVERLRYMIEDTEAMVGITKREIKEKLNNIPSINWIDLEDEGSLIEAQENMLTEPHIQPTDLAYIIYTSGSTGQPKGVMIGQGSLAASTWTRNQLYTNLRSILLIPSFSFDSSVAVLFGALTSGACLYILSEDAIRDAATLEKVLPHTDAILCVPSYYQFLLDEGLVNGSALTTAIVAGEKLEANLVAKHFRQTNNISLYNEYGPTEATVWTTVSRIDDIHSLVTIGRPIAGAEVYIVDAQLGLCPLGVPGELCVAGVQLARGYLNRHELTRDKFVPNPFGEGRLYRTGDLARWKEDGTIEYLGRLDDQVKIRGYRLELGEVEAALLAMPGMTQAAVVVNADGHTGQKKLVAYIVKESSCDVQKLRMQLQDTLPEYMIPGVFVELDALPLNANGKVDRKALTQKEIHAAGTNEYAAPQTPAEKILAGIWGELLGVENVSVQDNFFELGGDSIITIQVVSRARKQGVHLQPKDIFLHQNIAALARSLDAAAEKTSTHIAEQGLLHGSAGLLPIQQWFFENNNEQSIETLSHFNQSVLLSLDQQIHIETVRSAFEQLAAHHDALRFIYKKTEDGWTQTYAGQSSVNVHLHSMADIDPALLANHISLLANQYQQSLNIERGQLLQAVLIQTPDSETANRLLIIVHHLAVDGVSWRILLEDLEQLLTSDSSLPAKTSSYRDWEVALNDYAQKAQGQTTYWQKAALSYQPLPERQSSTTPANSYKHMGGALNSDHTRQLLQGSARAYSTEINDLLMAALGGTLCSWQGREEVVVGLEGHGREQSIAEGLDLSRTAGWFTTLYPVVLKAAPGGGLRDLILQTKETLRTVPDRGLGYGALKYTAKENTLQGNDPWDITFNYLGQSDSTFQRKESILNGAAESSGRDQSPLLQKAALLEINSVVRDGMFHIDIGYSSQHFAPERIEKLLHDFIDRLTNLVTHCIDQPSASSSLKNAIPADLGLSGAISFEELHHFLSSNTDLQSLYRLSPLQEGMLFHSLYDNTAGAYTAQFYARLHGLDRTAFQQAWTYLIEKHSTLRTAFFPNAFDIPVQGVLHSIPLPLIEKDLTVYPESLREEQLRLIEEEDRTKGFVWDHAPLMRLTLVRMAEDNYHLLWTSHHLILDGWSTPVLMQEFLETYEALVLHHPLPLIEEDAFEDFIRHIGQKRNDEQQYWTSLFSEVHTHSLLPFVDASEADRTRGVSEYREEKLAFTGEESNRITRFAQSCKVTVNTVLQGIWAYLLHCYTANERVVHGITVSGRPEDLGNMENRVGMYINTLPLVTHIRPGQPVDEWLQDIQAQGVLSQQYQYTSLPDIQKWIGAGGTLFDTLVAFQNYPVSEVINAREWQLKVSALGMNEQTSNYPLSLRVMLEPTLCVQFIYKNNNINKEYVQMVRGHFDHVLTQLLNGRSRLGDIELLTAEERQQLLVSFNGAKVDYPLEDNLVTLFSRQAEQTPDAVALRYMGRSMSFSELDARSSQLAHYLIELGVTRESIIPFCLERSPDVIISILAILKAGAAFTPIDPSYPQERIRYMLEDTKASLVISSTRHRELLQELAPAANVIALDAHISQLSAYSEAIPDVHIDPSQLAYIIYTSGSTGRPKGVMIEHRSVINLICNQQKPYDLRAGLKVFQFASLSFDASCHEIFCTLWHGGTLVLAPQEVILDPIRLSALLEREGVEMITLPPSYQAAIKNEMANLKTVISAGETLDRKLAEELMGKGIKLVNAYGPTENTVCAALTSEPIHSTGAITIGKPIDNVEIYILNEAHKPVPTGVPGEICLGGPQLARGYWGQPALTAERFITNPFGPGRLYKTGDLARWLMDGHIEFIGRRDDQVKIRGYRVELGEIEETLSRAPGVHQGVIVASKENESTRLLAFVVGKTGYDRKEAQSYLMGRLPEYMMPSLWIELDALPLTANGKIDRKQLQGWKTVSEKTEKALSDDPLEAALVAIFADVLELDAVDASENFFDLGGHSLLAIRAISAIRKQLQLELEIKDLFDYPTAKELAQKLSGTTPASGLLPLIPRPEEERIPLSFAQERLWFIDQLQGTKEYHLPFVFRLRGRINTGALQTALQELIRRHRVLRTVIREQEGEGYQYLLPSANWQLHLLGKEDALQQSATMDNFIRDCISAPFDLSSDYMIKCWLVEEGPEEHIFIGLLHHIAADGWSISIVVEELSELYAAQVANRTPKLRELPVQYSDYAIWQRGNNSGEVMQQKLDYWKTQLSGLEPLELPTDFIRPARQSFAGAKLALVADPELAQALNDLSQQLGVTLFMTLWGSFAILLERYTGRPDIQIGTPSAGRGQQELEGLIGFFINMLVLRSEVGSEQRFDEWMQGVKQTTLDAFTNGDISFDRLVNVLGAPRDLSRHPIFQVLFSLQNIPEAQPLFLGDVELEQQGSESLLSKYDLSLHAAESAGLHLVLTYCTDLFTEESMQRLLRHYAALLQAIVQQPSLPIKNLSFLSDAESTQLLQVFNHSTVDYPEEKTVVHLFDEQALLHPDASALVYEGQSLTYRELQQRSNMLAAQLLNMGVQSEECVLVSVQRSMDMIVGMLAILKAGAAFVPVDPSYPEERLSYMVQDTGCRICLCDETLAQKMSSCAGVSFINPKDISHKDEREEGINLSTPYGLAYIIYTSGSTGRPKGVMIEHRSLMDHVFGVIEKAGLDDCASFALFASLAADAGHSILYSALALGKTVHVLSEDRMLDGVAVSKYLKEHRIDGIKLVPSLWLSYRQDAPMPLPQKLIIFGGEAFSPSIVSLLNEAGFKGRVYNHYGPTEITIGKCIYRVNLDKEYSNVPIGVPFSNSTAYIIDRHGSPCPVGVPGELLIGGDGVARGYLNLPELTKERFVSNPFGTGRLYKTGDLVKWLEDGNILYLGRRDEQVKIRGHRIELGEIETVLAEIQGIRQAAVRLQKSANGLERLIGYVVVDEAWNKEEAEASMVARLPDYMTPSCLVVLPQLPVTTIGKINKKALPDVEIETAQSDLALPVTQTEQTLLAVWQKLLGIEAIGVHHNFFSLGGHSLLAMRVVAAVRTALGKELKVKDIFAYPTIAQLSRHLDSVLQSTRNGITKQERPGLIPLSFAQERLWFIDRLQGSQPYHIPHVMRLKGSLDVAALSASFVQLVDRHESLRTVIVEEEGKGYQQVRGSGDWLLQEIDIKDAIAFLPLPEYIDELLSAPFDLSVDYMLKAWLIRVSEEEHLLATVMHHIASDGWSMGILVKELAAFYKAFSKGEAAGLPQLPVQYADYAIWQRNYLSGEKLEEEIGYWKGALNDLIATELPADFVRPPVQNYTGATAGREVPATTYAALQRLSQEEGTTLFMTLLAAFKILLYRYSPQDSVHVGTPLAGRRHAEVEGLIGFFINTLVLRSRINTGMPFNELLQQVKETTLEAYEHQDLPFEKIVEILGVERNPNKNPVFQILFALHNEPEAEELHLGDVVLEAESPGKPVAKFDITMNALESSGGLYLSLQYNTDLFAPATIHRLLDQYLHLLEGVCAAPHETVGRLSLAGEAEEQLLLQWSKGPDPSGSSSATILDLWAEVVRNYPDHEALIEGKTSYTYQQVDERSSQWAHWLRANGVAEETLVPLVMDRSATLIIGILAILKAGGAYVPLDPSTPADRLKYLFDEMKPGVIVSLQAHSEMLQGIAPVASIILVDDEQMNKGSWPLTPPEVTISVRSLAYLLYTSGSTGRPKGVLVEHGNVTSLVAALRAQSPTHGEALLVTGAVSFDATTFEYWGTLLGGGRLIVCTNELLLDRNYLRGLLRQHSVRVMWLTAGWFNELAQEEAHLFKGLRTLFVGGDRLSVAHINLVQKACPGLQLVNGYGPTENTTFSLTCTIGKAELDHGRDIALGKPLAARTAYILDANGSLCPLGVPGELHVGGAGVARGYYEDRDLTGERFVPNPFGPGLLYRTGDWTRWRNDGQVEFLGRLDDQVKIRGYRVEPGEVETLLQGAPGVAQAAVVVQGAGDEGKKLVGFIVPAPGFSRTGVEQWLQDRLPAYMIPSGLAELSQLPLTSNGKVDRKQLETMTVELRHDAGFVVPRNELEEQLCTIWQKLLKLPEISVLDNFFAIGGHSLMAMRVTAAIRKEFNVELSIRDFFQLANIESLAKYIRVQAANSSVSDGSYEFMRL